MQYLLTVEEYYELKQKADKVLLEHKEKLQELCTLAAMYVPVERPWMGDDSEPSPWGCILSEEHDPGYCDDCPSQKLCPSSKKYSK